MENLTNALVLGGGGPYALAWPLAVLETLAPDLDDDLRAVGTSAGAIAGAVYLRGSDARRAVMSALRAVPTNTAGPVSANMALAARVRACTRNDTGSNP